MYEFLNGTMIIKDGTTQGKILISGLLFILAIFFLLKNYVNIKRAALLEQQNVKKFHFNQKEKEKTKAKQAETLEISHKNYGSKDFVEKMSKFTKYH